MHKNIKILKILEFQFRKNFTVFWFYIFLFKLFKFIGFNLQGRTVIFVVL